MAGYLGPAVLAEEGAHSLGLAGTHGALSDGTEALFRVLGRDREPRRGCRVTHGQTKTRDSRPREGAQNTPRGSRSLLSPDPAATLKSLDRVPVPPDGVDSGCEGSPGRPR